MAAAEHRGRVMASDLHAIVSTGGERPDPSWSSGLAAMLGHLERCWSRFLPQSDISRLNLAGGRPVHVDPTTITLVGTLIEAWHRTEHRFDPTTLPALVAAGYATSVEDDRRVTLLPTGEIHVGGFDRASPTLDDIEIDADDRTVRLPTGLTLDAGGIGKGLAADLAAAWLVDRHGSGALVSVGGDLATAGATPDGGWVVHVEHPAGGEVGTIAVDGGGVATSSTRSRRWQHDDKEQHHVIDPWTGAPSTTDLSSATVIATSGWLAEAHATAALLAGAEQVVDHLDRHELSGLAVTSCGQVLATRDLMALARPPAAGRLIGAIA